MATTTYDAMLSRSGLSTGGWAAKELTEKGTQTRLVPKQAGSIVPERGYVEHVPVLGTQAPRMGTIAPSGEKRSPFSARVLTTLRRILSPVFRE